MDRTFSFDARAVVPTTHGFTSEIPNAGNIRMKPTNNHNGTASRTGASHGEPMEPRRKYATLKIKYASDSALRIPGQSAAVPPKIARNHTMPPNKPVSVPVCSVGKFSFSWR